MTTVVTVCDVKPGRALLGFFRTGSGDDVLNAGDTAGWTKGLSHNAGYVTLSPPQFHPGQ